MNNTLRFLAALAFIALVIGTIIVAGHPHHR